MEQFLTEVREYAALRGISPSKVVRDAINSEWSRWSRWEAGESSPRVQTIDSVRTYMANNSPAQEKVGQA